MKNVSVLIQKNYSGSTDEELKETKRGMADYINTHQFTHPEMCRTYQECIEEIMNEQNRRAFARWNK